jgi:N-acylneuraminate cytidylyltransferase
MKVAALLTGRGNNTLKDKNILPVLGKPLLYYPAMAAKSCGLVSDFYCSSDCDKILAAAADCGYKPIKRPAALALPTAQHVDAIVHALGEMKKDGVEPDILVVLLANSGIVKSEWIRDSIQSILDNPELSSACPVEKDQDHHPFRAKRLRADGCLEPFFNFSGQKISTNRQDLCECFYFCHNFWTLNLTKTLYSDVPGQPPWGFMGNNIKPIVVEDCFDVHDLDDIVRTEKWLMENGIPHSV